VSELDRATVVRRAPHVLGEAVGDVVVVLDPEADAYVRLNRTGARLWQALAEPRTVGELADDLAGAYRLEPGRALADATAYVDDLVARGLATAG
jgi:hypothetical protein